MSDDSAVRAVILQYLANVEKSLSYMSKEGRATLLGELREHIDEAIIARTCGKEATLRDAYAVLSELDLPESYAEAAATEAEERNPNRKLIILAVVCSFLQMVGLLTTVAGIPVLGAVAGFAAIVSFFLVWSNRRSPKWLVRLTAIAAVCGLGMILIEMAMAL